MKVRETLEALAYTDGQGCVYWTRPFAGKRPFVNKGVHPAITRGMSASRAVWIIRHGQPPSGLQVLHTCGNSQRGCVGIDCLYLGTPQDNMNDREQDGHTRRGAANGRAKLTEADILEIRRSRAGWSPERGRRIAAKYGITYTAARHIVTRQTWTHI